MVHTLLSVWECCRTSQGSSSLTNVSDRKGWNILLIQKNFYLKKAEGMWNPENKARVITMSLLNILCIFLFLKTGHDLYRCIIYNWSGDQIEVQG